MFRDLAPAIARADGSLRSAFVRFVRIDVPVIDDWAMAPLAETECRNFWESSGDRYRLGEGEWCSDRHVTATIVRGWDDTMVGSSPVGEIRTPAASHFVPISSLWAGRGLPNLELTPQNFSIYDLVATRKGGSFKFAEEYQRDTSWTQAR